MKVNFLKYVYIFLAFLFLGIGGLGVVLPILPTTPFLLLASYFFAKGSKRFHDWFVSTKLYKDHLESFIRTRAMTLKKKLCILLPVSTMLITTAVLVDNIYARIGIGFLIILKYYYFFTHIETIKNYDKENQKNLQQIEDKLNK